MPSEGKPQPIDTAAITAPSDVPTADLWLLAERRARHAGRVIGQDKSGASAADALAALALGAAIRRVLDDQEQHLVREGLRHGATWEQLARALGLADSAQAQTAFVAWAQQLPNGEATEALRLAGLGKGQ
ncbi:hypothetical protein [Streptomyces lonegramiae]|uniref:ANTAR domain-containing protein n=1 Tax=Streptomyces lonegramiae TaxID=3075524 RepID=A0ABU2XL57_9ACTN|nr:hypothetical protein [Streptomyces sp. DSM 41529]MDT0545608.1 hypothetical protein [Streptomyces sp. DSM 41529]